MNGASVSTFKIIDNFNGECEVINKTFTNYDGKEIEKEFIINHEFYLYNYRDEEKNIDAYSFSVGSTDLIYVLPINGDINSIDVKNIDFSNVEFKRIPTGEENHGYKIYLPTFEIDNIHTKMSVGALTEKHNIDIDSSFSNFFNEKLDSENLYISQKNKFELDEYGIKGSSVTAMAISGGNPVYDYEFIIDQPHYLYSVIRKENLPLFSMRILNL